MSTPQEVYNTFLKDLPYTEDIRKAKEKLEGFEQAVKQSNTSRLVELAARRVHLENEWARLQDEQGRIISEMTK